MYFQCHLLSGEAIRLPAMRWFRAINFAKTNAAQICASRNACARLAQHKASSKAGSAGLGPQSPQMRTVFVVPPSLPPSLGRCCLWPLVPGSVYWGALLAVIVMDSFHELQRLVKIEVYIYIYIYIYINK